MKSIKLPANHTRALSSALLIVEKSLVELESLLRGPVNYCCHEVVRDVNDDAVIDNLELLRTAREQICNLAIKYGTRKEKQTLRRIINAKKARIWEILTDTLSGKIRSYGAFPEAHSAEYDSDINMLLTTINRIR